MSSLPDFFGLNLGRYSIKFAHSRVQGNGKPKLFSLGSLTTSSGLLDNDTEQGSVALASELTRLVKSFRISTANCVLAVPESAVFSRLITLPTSISEQESSEAIQWSLKPLLPMPLEEVNISYLDIDTKIIEGNSFTNWYVVAAPKLLIERMQNITQKAGLNLLAVETESLATTRLVTNAYREYLNKDIMIVDFGAESTNLILSRNSVVMFSQIINTGSSTISKVISGDLGVDILQAENYKITNGLLTNSPEGSRIANSIEPVIQIIINEILRTISYYKEKIGGPNIGMIFLTGGGADLPGLDNYMNNRLSMPVTLINPINNIDIVGNVKKQMKNIHIKSYNVAIGLSIKTR